MEEKLLARLTLNPGLALTGFQTTWPCHKVHIFREIDVFWSSRLLAGMLRMRSSEEEEQDQCSPISIDLLCLFFS